LPERLPGNYYIANLKELYIIELFKLLFVLHDKVVVYKLHWSLLKSEIKMLIERPLRVKF
jgi:hypothetical protein